MRPRSNRSTRPNRMLTRTASGDLVEVGTGVEVTTEELARALGTGARFSVRDEVTGTSCTYLVLAEVVRARLVETTDPMVQTLMAAVGGWSSRDRGANPGEEQRD